MPHNSSPIFAIKRHRIEIDGPGVRTLVGFCGCPLKCVYCINPQCQDLKGHYLWTPRRLLEFVKIDAIYFEATNGGITFGGGEPGLYLNFIRNFRSLCPSQWSLAIETSLNYNDKILASLMEIIDYYIIDIKDMSETIYKDYTTKDNSQVLNNLRLLSINKIQDKCLIRIPFIPNFNSQQNIEYSINQIKNMGFTNIDVFNYILK